MRFKWGIRRRIIIFISLTILLVAMMGFLLGYFSTLDLLKNAVGSDYGKIADALAFNVQQGINEEASCIKGLMTDSMFKKALKESNSRYQKMLPADIQRFMTDMDRQWIKADKDSPLMKEYLETDISRELRDKIKANAEITEVFISDKYGGLVAASGKTTDFYQADKGWWQDAFAEGRGEIFVGGIESDESSKTLGMVFALPIKDDNGQVIGVAKAAIDIQRLFNFLEDFKFGHTGQVALVDEEGYVLSRKGIKPLSRKLLSDVNFQKIIQSKTQVMIINSRGVQSNRILSAFAEVKSSLLLKKGIVWRIFVEQDAKDVLWPLYRLTLQAVGVILFLIILIPIFGFILGSKISRPIEKLKEASDHITKGELDYPVRIKTGDELEELANSFRVMALSIKERENQLINQKAYLEGIVTSIVDVLIVVNLDTTLKSVNKAALDLLGYAENELIGQPVNKILLPGRSGEEFSEYFENIINKGAVYDISLTFISKEGKKIPADFSGAAMREEEKIIGIVVVAKDMRQIMEVISNLEKKERELKEHDKNLIRMQRAMLHMMDDLQEALSARAQFTGMVSHELRTPLAAIKEGVSVVLDKITGDINEEQAKYLSMVKNNVDRLSRLINAVLDFQTLESGKMEFKMEENDINEVVKEVQQMMLPLAEKKSLDFTLQLDEYLPRIKFDRDKIVQVLVNLVNNAFKFTDKGSIIITTGKGENFIQIAVRDTGSGIKEENIQKLFQEFTQLQRKVGGTGLGLSICKKIVEAHKGKIWAGAPSASKEEGFGKGAVFYFTLPIKERRA